MPGLPESVIIDLLSAGKTVGDYRRLRFGHAGILVTGPIKKKFHRCLPV